MKANQAFKNNEEAVSPVIGVILMVAITVVLAAVVFVLVSDLGGGGESAPTMSWDKSESTDRLAIIQADENADWARLSVRVTGCTTVTTALPEIRMGTATPFQNDVATATGGALNDPSTATAPADTTCGEGNLVPVTSAVAAITAGDFLMFCADNAATLSAPTSVQIQITDTTANQVIYTTTFQDIALCA